MLSGFRAETAPSGIGPGILVSLVTDAELFF